MRTPFALVVLLLLPVSTLAMPQPMTAVQREAQTRAALMAKRTQIVESGSRAHLVEGGIALGLPVAGGVSASVGVAGTTEGGMRQLKLTLGAEANRTNLHLGAMAHAGGASYEAVKGPAIPTSENRFYRGFSFFAGKEQFDAGTSWGDKRSTGRWSAKGARLLVGLGATDSINFGGRGVKRATLQIPLSPKWKSPELRRVDRALRQLDSAAQKLVVGNERAAEGMIERAERGLASVTP